MTNRQLTEDEKKRIVEKIKLHIADNRHSNCRVGSKVKEVIGEYIDAYGTNEISALVTKDSKYLRTRDSSDWTIIMNPNHSEPTMLDKFAKPIALIETIFIIISIPIGLYIQSNSKQLEQDKQQLTDTISMRDQRITDLENLLKKKDKEIEGLTKSLDSLQNIKK